MRRRAYARGNTKVAQLGRSVVHVDIRIRVGTTGFIFGSSVATKNRAIFGRLK